MTQGRPSSTFTRNRASWEIRISRHIALHIEGVTGRTCVWCGDCSLYTHTCTLVLQPEAETTL